MGGPSPDPSQMGGPMGGFKPPTSPQMPPQPAISPHLNPNTGGPGKAGKGGPGGNPMSPVDMPGGMMSSPQHLGFNSMDGLQPPQGGGGGQQDNMMSNDPYVLIRSLPTVDVDMHFSHKHVPITRDLTFVVVCMFHRLASLEGFDSNGMSHPGGPMGGPSPGPGGRMGGLPAGSPYGGPMGPAGGGPPGGPRGRTNVQVRPDAPNTIQYLPARSQGPGQHPGGPMHNSQHQRPPSLDFLQRFVVAPRIFR